MTDANDAARGEISAEQRVKAVREVLRADTKQEHADALFAEAMNTHAAAAVRAEHDRWVHVQERLDKAEQQLAQVTAERDEIRETFLATERERNSATAYAARVAKELESAKERIFEHMGHAQDRNGERIEQQRRAEQSEAEAAALRALLGQVQRYGNELDTDCSDDHEDAAVPRGWFTRRDAALAARETT